MDLADGIIKRFIDIFPPSLATGKEGAREDIWVLGMHILNWVLDCNIVLCLNVYVCCFPNPKLNKFGSELDIFDNQFCYDRPDFIC